MFLALVLLLSHPAPVATSGIAAILNANGSVQWQAPGVLPAVPAEDIRALGVVPKGAAIVVSNVVSQGGEEPSVASSQNGQGVPLPHRLVPNGPHRWLIAAVLPVTQTKVGPVVTEGIATGAWQTAGTVELNKGQMGKRTGQGFVRMVRPDEKPGGKKALQLVVVDTAMPTDSLSYVYRVQVFGKGGQPLIQTSNTPPTATGDQSFAFQGDFKATTRVLLQQRPYKWLTTQGR